MKKNAYPDRSQAVNEIFNSNDLNKVLVVPIDFAKEAHTAHMCTGTGEFLLKHPLKIFNNMQGVTYLKDRIKRTCSKHKILKENVIIGSEDPPGYLFNFVNMLKASDYLFVRVNAAEAKKFRDNTRASSDKVDLNGICQAIINRRARDVADFDSLYMAMKAASRSRKKLVREQTVFKNQIHKCVDILFPGFLDEQKSGISPFCNASLKLMENRFSVIRIRRMSISSLTKILSRNKLSKPVENAAKLKAFTEKVLSPPADIVQYYSKSLAVKIEMLRIIAKNIHIEENQIARCLVQTPGFYLTSLPGAGVVTAGGIMGEVGQSVNWSNIDHLASYGGIVPRQKQTGGKPAVKLGLPYKANKKLKSHLFQFSFGTAMFKHPAGKIYPHLAEHRLYSHFYKVQNREGKSGISTAKLFLKIAKQMILQQRIYLPQQWLDLSFDVPSEENRLYFLSVLNSLKEKWKAYDLDGILDNANFFAKELNAYDELIKFRNSK